MSYLQDMFDVVAAQLLHEWEVVQAPERLVQFEQQPVRRLSEVLVTYQGLRLLINGQVISAHQPITEFDQTVNQTQARIESGVAHLGLVIGYSPHLREFSVNRLRHRLPKQQLWLSIVTEAGASMFVEGTLDDVPAMLSEAFAKLNQEDVVASAVTLLDEGIEQFAKTMLNQAAVVAGLSHILGIPEQTAEPLPVQSIAKLPVEQRGAICRIAGLTIINALISQALLSQSDPRVKPLADMTSRISLKTAFVNHWVYIVDQINYHSLFHLATKLVDSLYDIPVVTDCLAALVEVAQRIVSDHSLALRHDLMGRVYHRLLAEAKYLGIFYTTIPAASLLAKLALHDMILPLDSPETSVPEWHDMERIGQLRVADLSCGTGTLLMATADALADKYINAATADGQQPDTAALHQTMLEQVLHGYDVLPSAVHLTASTLALRAPRIDFKHFNLFSLPLGGDEHRLGSLEFLPDDSITFQQYQHDHGDETITATMPKLDLCIINPPFTRSVGGNLLFGSLTDQERRPMQKKLGKMVRKPEVLASTIAGLGAIFVATADQHLKVGGRLALVLPKAFISGVAWEATRKLLRHRYRVDHLITSHDPARWNFSESTELSEVLVVATKLNENDLKTIAASKQSFRVKNQPTPEWETKKQPQIRATSAPSLEGEPSLVQDNQSVVAVNLWHNPANNFEALALATSLTHNMPVPTGGVDRIPLRVGHKRVGEAVRMPWSHLQGKSSWMLPCAFAQADLIQAAYHLEQGGLWMPNQGVVAHIPLRRLGDLGQLGPDRRDIHDACTHSEARTDYPAFWGQSAKVNSLEQTANKYLTPLTERKPGRPWPNFERLWSRSGRLLLLERLRLNTQSVVAVRCPQPVLSNMWWEFSCHADLISKKNLIADEVEKTLALWFNSSLGLLSLLAHRQETQGAWVAFKKPTLTNLPVLDVTNLTADQRSWFAFTYDEIAHLPLFPFPEMHLDPIRSEIDHQVAALLGLPDFDHLRDLLAHEPVVGLQRLSG
ncbi:hypothetical protein QUF64_01600 [Anaerolineales bacterium HSG6]|nr:hypothetical protein [Anaerolineales bacterium HSG6]